MTNSIKLATPIEFGGTTYTEIALRAPKVRDLKAMDKFVGDTGKFAALIASVSGIPLLAIDDLGMVDFTAVSAEMAAFMGESQTSAEGGSTS